MRSPSGFRGSTRGRFASAIIAAAVAGTLLVVLGALWAAGIIDLSRFRATPRRSMAGLVGVPVPARPLRAYARITRDDFWDAKANQLTAVYLPAGSVNKEMLTQLSDIIGRVLNHDKRPGFVFTEADFFPPGTREGVVAGIPPGKRAIRVPGDKVDGFFDLRPGDRFDLLATIAISGRGGPPGLGSVGGVYGPQLALQAQLTNWQRQATVHVMVQNGIVVMPLMTRQIPIFQNTMTQGGVTRMRPVQEVVIAIEPEEVAELTQAMAVDAKISVVPRSGQPGDLVDSVTPGLRPVSPFLGLGSPVSNMTDDPDAVVPAGAPTQPFTMVDTINGSSRKLTAVPHR